MSLPRPLHQEQQTASQEEVTESPIVARGEDAETLRALESPTDTEESRNTSEHSGAQPPLATVHGGETSDWDEELPQATVSFDIETTEQVDTTVSSWSAELRSAVEPKRSNRIIYRMTELTMMPTILAADGLKEIAIGVILLPFEAIMVRVIARSFQRSTGGSMSSFYNVFDFKNLIPAAGSLFGAFAMQLIMTGVFWAGFTLTSTLLYTKPLTTDEEGEDSDGS